MEHCRVICHPCFVLEACDATGPGWGGKCTLLLCWRDAPDQPWKRFRLRITRALYRRLAELSDWPEETLDYTGKEVY